MKRQAFDILVVEPSDFYQQVAQKILENDHHRILFCSTLDCTRTLLKEKSFDCIIMDTDIPDGDVFDFQKNELSDYGTFPMIITTERNVDEFIEFAVETNSGNILCKPVKREELLILIQKLVTKQAIFGLQNYLNSPTIIHSIEITNSKQIDTSISTIMNYAKQNGFNFTNDTLVRLSMQEVLVNAVYHSFGYTQQKMERTHITLQEGERVNISYGHDLSKFGISITDSAGKLRKESVLNTLRDVVVRERSIKEKIDKGEDISEFLIDGGRGIDLFRKISGEYLINIEPNKRTEIILIYDMEFDKDDLMRPIKIIEI